MAAAQRAIPITHFTSYKEMNNTLQEELIGSWELRSFHSVSPEEAISYPLGQNAVGILMYSEDGCVAVNIMKAERTGVVESALYANGELRYLDLPYLSYTGTYIVDAKRPSVTHLVEVCIYPEWIGQKQFRLIRWNAGELELTSDTSGGTAAAQFSLLWRRKFSK
jgi:hypothetical protein